MMDRVGTRLETIDMSGMTCKIGKPTRFNNGGHTLKTIKLGWDWINVTSNPDYFLADFYSLENIEWGTNIKININNLWKINEQQKLTVQSLVNLFNALYNFSTDGGTHTVIIGATNIAKLTREQMLIAIKKHWTIQGAPIQGVFRDTDISTLTSDDTVTAVAIELTADNYLTRIDEVLGVYTNAVDVYFFDDGSVTTLDNMCYNNNTTTKDRIQNVTFLDGYFENCTSFKNTLRELKGLVTVTGMPDNVTDMTYAFFNIPTLISVSKIPSKCTNFNVTFRGCGKLTSVPVNGWTGDLYMVFMECNLLNQQINITNPRDLSYTFCGCGELTISPTFTGAYTENIDNLFSGCSKLTSITLPTTWRPSSAKSTFSGCTQLVTIENLDALDMSNCYNCFNMFNSCGLQDYSSIENWNLSSCSSFANMFDNAKCTGSIDISKWTTSTGAIHKMFSGSYFTSINVSNLVKSGHNNISEMFRGARASEIIGMDTWDTSNITNWFYAFGGCSNLKELNISNWVFKDVDYNNAWIWVGTSFDKIIANNIYASNPSKVAYFLNDPVKGIKCSVKEFIMDDINPNQTNFSAMFEGTNIKNDIIFPSWATNVSNCFKGCTGMTHIHSNWKTEYTAMENTTDCYAGCTGITHCDGVDLGVNEYITGLDEVPTNWGGYGFDKYNTLIMTIDTNLGNTLSITMFWSNQGLREDRLTNWGDGTIDAEVSHTYAEHGIYHIKTKAYNINQVSMPGAKYVTEVENIPPYRVICDNFFEGCSNLTRAIGYNLTPTTCYNMFRGCSSLTEIIGLDTWDMSNCTNYSNFLRDCSSITYDTLLQSSNVLDFSSCINNNGALENIFNGVTFDDAVPLQRLNVSPIRSARDMLIGIKVNGDLDLSMWDIHPTILEGFLSGATINGAVNLSGWDVSNCTNFKRMLYWPSGITSVNLSGWDFSNGNSDSYAFLGCPASDWNFTGASGIKFNIIITNPQNHSVDSLVGLFNALYDFASAGNTNTHTIEIGSTNLAKLTNEQKMIAVNKGWKLAGYPVIKITSSVNLSSVDADNSITKAYVELTSDNVATRMSEVMTAYPNITELYFYENGSVTSLDGLFTSLDISIKSQFTKIVFMNGHFNNVSDMTEAIREVGSLDEIPVSWGGYGLDKNVTSIYVIDTTHLTNTTTFNLVLQDNQAGITDWGDGVINSEKSHTYAEHGVYTIKTKSSSHGYAPSNDLQTALIEIKQIKLIGHNGTQNYSQMFSGCGNLRKVTAYDLAPTNCDSMFYKCWSLTEIIGMETWDMSNCTTMSNMFHECSSLPNDQFQVVSTWNAPKVNDMARAFEGASLLTSIDISNFTLVDRIDYAFIGCSNLEYVKLGGNITRALQAFRFCSSLTRIDNFNFNGYSGHYMFNGCNKLSNIEWKGVLSFGELGNNLFMMQDCPLSVNTMVSLFNILAKVTEAQTLNLGSTNLAKLTAEQIAIATNKGWTLQ